jgi:hypothetical protein
MIRNYSVFDGFTLIGRLAAFDDDAAYEMAFRIYGAEYGKHIRVEDEG